MNCKIKSNLVCKTSLKIILGKYHPILIKVYVSYSFYCLIKDGLAKLQICSGKMLQECICPSKRKWFSGGLTSTLQQKSLMPFTQI